MGEYVDRQVEDEKHTVGKGMGGKRQWVGGWVAGLTYLMGSTYQVQIVFCQKLLHNIVAKEVGDLERWVGGWVE